MAYRAYEWKPYDSGGTPITFTRLNAIEQGLQAVSEAVELPDGSRNGWANFLTDWHGTADGVTDQTFGLNQALAAGGMLYLPPGDYFVQDQLRMYSTMPTVLFGPGRIISVRNDAILLMANAAHILDGVTIQGSGAALDSQAGVIVYADNCSVRNCTITSVSRFGVHAEGANIRIEDNNFDNCSLGTLYDSASASTVYVTGNYVKAINNTLTNTRWGITYEGVDLGAPNLGGFVQGNRLVARASAPSGGRGISGTSVRHLRVVNNDSAGYSGANIYQHGGQFTIIGENNCYDGVGDGIFIGHDGTRHVDIVSNNVVNCSTGIRIWDGAESIEVDGNSIAECKVGLLAFGANGSGELPLANVRIESNTISADGTQFGGLGIGVSNVDGFTVADNTVRNANHEGIFIGGVSTVGKVADNTVRDASADTSGTWAGIRVEGTVAGVLLDDNIVTGATEVGIQLDSGVTGARLRGNRWQGALTGISDLGTATVLSDNGAF